MAEAQLSIRLVIDQESLDRAVEQINAAAAEGSVHVTLNVCSSFQNDAELVDRVKRQMIRDDMTRGTHRR